METSATSGATRPAQNHDGYKVTLTAPDGTVLGATQICFSDAVGQDGSAGALYVQNGEAFGVVEKLVQFARPHVAATCG